MKIGTLAILRFLLYAQSFGVAVGENTKGAGDSYIGWRWLFTPTKPWFAVHPDLNQPAPWYAHKLWQDHFLDVRVLIADAAILAILLFIIPALAKWLMRGVAATRTALTSLTAGVAFSVILVVYPRVMHQSQGLPVVVGIFVAAALLNAAAIALRYPSIFRMLRTRAQQAYHSTIV